MLKIYHAKHTRSIRVIWLCEELGVEYEVEKIDFSKAYRATPQWRAISPLGKVPIMTDGDLTMFESGAMVQHILNKHGKGALQPKLGSHEHAEYLQWFWFAEATLARPLGEIVNHAREFPDAQRISTVVEEMAHRAMACLQLIGDHMKNRQYLVGDAFSAADIMTGYSLMLANMIDEVIVPNSIGMYWRTLQSRPSYQISIQV